MLFCTKALDPIVVIPTVKGVVSKHTRKKGIHTVVLYVLIIYKGSVPPDLHDVLPAAAQEKTLASPYPMWCNVISNYRGCPTVHDTVTVPGGKKSNPPSSSSSSNSTGILGNEMENLDAEEGNRIMAWYVHVYHAVLWRRVSP